MTAAEPSPTQTGTSEWWELSASAEPEAVESVAAAFAEWGQGVAIEQPVESSRDGDEVTYPTDRPVIVRTYLPLLDPRAQERLSQLEKAVWALGKLREVGPLTVRTIREEDWENSWKAYFFVHRVGARCVIVPTWRRDSYAPRPGDVLLLLDPGMAFGTGLHPTTRLCLQQLECLDLAGKRVLDLGAGSGILAIAAARMGAAQVEAVEIDPVAARACRENVAANDVDGQIRVTAGSLDWLAGERPLCDVAVANISIRVILANFPKVSEACKPGATVVFSGVLEERAHELESTLTECGWVHLRTEREHDWVALVATTPVAPPVG